MALLADLSARAVLGATWHSWPGGLKDLCCNLQQLAARRLHDLHLRIDQRPGSARLVSSQRAEIRCSRARSREATAGARLTCLHRRGFHQQACDSRRRDCDGRTRPLHGQHFHRTAVALDQVRRSAFESLRRWLRGAVRHQFLDDLLQFSAPSPGDEQPNADGGVARRHGQNRGGGEGCGYAASLGQRKRVAHIPTAETEAARSSLILEGQRQARSHLKFNPSSSHEWGPVHWGGSELRKLYMRGSPTMSPRSSDRMISVNY
jgi:hypothetical protein